MKHGMRRKLITSAAIIGVVAVALCGYTFLVIYQGVKAACITAQNEYKSECVSALVQVVQSDTHSVKEKNTAIWALGQLADKRALPVLESFYTGIIPPREARDVNMSQYELQKAIRWCRQGNITSWMYGTRDAWR